MANKYVAIALLVVCMLTVAQADDAKIIKECIEYCNKGCVFPAAFCRGWCKMGCKPILFGESAVIQGEDAPRKYPVPTKEDYERATKKA